MQNPAQKEIELTTAPSEEFETHWGQQVRLFFFFLIIKLNQIDVFRVGILNTHLLMAKDYF